MNQDTISIFVIDDEEAITSHFLDYLEDYPEFQVKAFGSAEDALRDLPLERPQVSIVDMRLPGMNGSDFVNRAKEICPECRFLINSGSVDLRLTPVLIESGLTEQDLFFKPGDMTKILDRIRQLFPGVGA